MEKLVGKNKLYEEQVVILKDILFKNEDLKKLLQILENSEISKYPYYVAAGCINQTVFNYYHDFESNYGIKDYDIVYYDLDTSYEAEDKIIKSIMPLIKELNIEVDIKNEARVHLWYKDKFGTDIKPYTSLEEAVASWGATVTCVGVRLENGNLKVYAPYGLNDIFNGIIRPLKENGYKEDRYLEKSTRWKSIWSNLLVIPWNDEN